MAKVSVIMPAYNVAPYISAAIESVCAQTVTDWELLIVDDGSTDSTSAIAGTYIARDPRIRLLHQGNGGISAARNRALRDATGEFLAILDSDDLWEPRYLEAQLGVFSRHPDVDIVTGNGWFLGGRRHGLPTRPWPDSRPQPTLTEILGDDECIFIMSIMRRRVYDTIGGFDERLRSNEDFDFWARAALAGFRFWRNDEPLGHYRRRPDSVSANHIGMINGVLRVCDKLRPMLADRPGELRSLETLVTRFERERLVTQARQALDSGDAGAAAHHLSTMYAHHGGTLVMVASVLARWAPGLLFRMYQIRRARQEATP
ncbi:MAG: glycosyltransferase family 2 protein [Vicinamibacterales bacterium]